MNNNENKNHYHNSNTRKILSQECDEGRLSWDPSGDELTPIPYKAELAEALSKRTKDYDYIDDADMDGGGGRGDDDGVRTVFKPKVGGGSGDQAGSSSSFLGTEYEEVIIPDNAGVAIEPEIIQPKSKPAPKAAAKAAPKAAAKPAAKAAAKPAPAKKPIYAESKKRKKTENNEARRGGKTTSI